VAGKLKYSTEEERLEAARASKRKYNKSAKGRKVMGDWYNKNKDDEEFKEMRNERQKEYRASLPEDVADLYKERDRVLAKLSRRDDPVRHMLYDAKKRAKRKGITFDLEWDDLTIPENCPVLGIPLFIGDGGRSANSPSLDRFDNNLGYTKDNVRIISLRANALKNDATVEEMRLILAYMEGVSNAVVCD